MTTYFISRSGLKLSMIQVKTSKDITGIFLYSILIIHYQESYIKKHTRYITDCLFIKNQYIIENYLI